MTPHNLHLGNGKMKGNSDRAQVRDFMDMAATHAGEGGIVLHFHGGLVDHAAGMGVAEKLDPIYRDANALPLFFVWEAGLWEILKNNLEELADEQLFKMIWKRVAHMVKRKMTQNPGARAAGTLPDISAEATNAAIEAATDGMVEALLLDEPPVPAELVEMTSSEEDRLVSELQYDYHLTTELANVTAGLRTPDEIERDKGSRSVLTVRSTSRSLLDPEALARYKEPSAPGAKGLISSTRFIVGMVKVAAQVIKRFINQRDHGFHATVVEEILKEFYIGNVGGRIWEVMKKDTLDAFKPGADVHGGTAVLTELKRIWDNGVRPKITLVGHSTGAIYIANMIDAAEELFGPGHGPQFDLIFLAPAATFTRYQQLLQAAPGRIRSLNGQARAFRMFTMSDEHERMDHLLSVIYPHSLLYFISGVLEADPGGDMPIVGMHRYYDKLRYPHTKFPDVVNFSDLISSHPQHAVWSVSEVGDGISSKAARHGDFDDDPITRSSLKHILSNGY